MTYDCHAAGITFHRRATFLDIAPRDAHDGGMTDLTSLTDDQLRDRWAAAMMARSALMRRASSSARAKARLTDLAPTLAALRAEWLRRDLKG